MFDVGDRRGLNQNGKPALELLGESGVVKPELLVDLVEECNELVAIITASVKTAQSKEPPFLHQQSNIPHQPFPST